MQLSCPSCATGVPAEDVNVTALVAKCRRCNEVFAFGARLAHGAAPPRTRPALPRGLTIESGAPPLPTEPGYRTAPARERGPLVITRRWFRVHHVFLLFFCIAWDAFLVNWYALGAMHGGPVIMFVFPIVHVAVGVGLTYSTLAGLLNRTTIRVADGALTVRHGPLPWWGAVTVASADLRQLYVRSVFHRSKGGGHYTWEVRAETEQATSIKLVSRVHDRDQAEYIEWAIEEHLGIADDPSYREAA